MLRLFANAYVNHKKCINSVCVSSLEKHKTTADVAVHRGCCYGCCRCCRCHCREGKKIEPAWVLLATLVFLSVSLFFDTFNFLFFCINHKKIVRVRAFFSQLCFRQFVRWLLFFTCTFLLHEAIHSFAIFVGLSACVCVCSFFSLFACRANYIYFRIYFFFALVGRARSTS